jgi:oligopeptide transport system permease protein
MKLLLKLFATGICLMLVIIMVSNINKGYISQVPDELKLYLWPTVSLEEMIEQYPQVRISNKQKNIVRVPYGKLDEYYTKLKTTQGISHVNKISITPSFVTRVYFFEIKQQIINYLHGDFGEIRYKGSTKAESILDQLPILVPRTLTYLIPGILFAILLGSILPILASLQRTIGKLLDAIHALMLCIPDFVLIILIQIIAIYLTKFSDKRVLLIVQLGNEVPFIIPFLTIALVPSVLIYGTLRMAIQRELSENYVRTAYAKGLSLSRILIRHVLRNIIIDLLTVLPKATTMAIASMVIAEVVCNIIGIGGYVLNPGIQNIGALAFTSMLLVLFALAFNGLFAWIGKWLVVRPKEVA